MNTVRLADLFDRLIAHAHRQSETADNLNRILFVRHQITNLITCLVHSIPKSGAKVLLFFDIRNIISPKSLLLGIARTAYLE